MSCHRHFGWALTPGSNVGDAVPELRHAIRDAFGSVIEAQELLAALDRCDLKDGSLLVGDDGLVLEYSEDTAGPRKLARAVTELRGLLSPLTPIRVQARAAGLFYSGEERIRDERTCTPAIIYLAQWRPGVDLDALVADLRTRAGLRARLEVRGAPSDKGGPGLAAELHRAFSATATSSEEPLTCAYSENPRTSGVPPAHVADLFMLAFSTLGADGRAGPTLLTLSRDVDALDWLRLALLGTFTPREGRESVILDGLEWEVGRRPIIAAPASTTSPLVIDQSACDRCGLCEQVAPEMIQIDSSGVRLLEGDHPDAISYDLVDLCPRDAIRKTYSKTSATLSGTLSHRPGWLSRLIGRQGAAFPSRFAPSFLRVKGRSEGPRYVLGLAVMTMQEHAAVLLRDGEVVGAIEEERLTRKRHYGWRAKDRPPFVTAAVDPTLCVEEAFCRKSIRILLEREGITLDDVELIAINGLHGRYRDLFSRTEDGPMPCVKVGRLVYVPHHLCHAASSFRVSGLESAWIFTVDGRGDRETAALFRAEEGKIQPVYSILSLDDTSIGGLYESATRLLGFGSHGQGSFMALASFGEPTVDVSSFLSVAPDGELTCHETGFAETFSDRARVFEGELLPKHHDLAASVQNALEETVEALIARGGVEKGTDGLCLAGGVTLNCQMNDRLRRAFRPEGIYAQPAANDAGTALGAALEAWALFGGGETGPMEHAYLGPEFSDDEIESVLRLSGLTYRRSEDVARAVAGRLAAGDILCFFQHRMEFGPRALGARSIIADPRSDEIKERANAIKMRQNWRPFGPSILAGYEDEYFEDAFDSRFMLFTQKIRPEKLPLLKAIAHVDGTTRPQVVHPTPNEVYYRMIKAFYDLTGIPMVLNTSFNRRGEPIVCTPEDALESFVGLGADALAIGSFLVERPAADFELPPLRAAQTRGFEPTKGEPVFHSVDPIRHDRLDGRRGNWGTMIRQLEESQSRLATIILAAGELASIGALVKKLMRAGVREFAFRFPTPIERRDGSLDSEHVPELAAAAGWVARVAGPLRARGIRVATEMIPLCLLPPEQWSYATGTPIAGTAPLPCRDCTLLERCPRSWPLYFELVGTQELQTQSRKP